MFAGQLDEAEVEARTMLELSPEFSYGRYQLSIVLVLKGESAAALEVFKQSSGAYNLAGLSFAYHAARQKEASDAALRELIERFSDVSAYQVAEAHAFRGEKDEAFAWLDRAYRQRDPGLTALLVDPLFDSTRSDPRFSAMLRKLKLPV
jgi:serine/threonine-protein kinase